MFAARPEQRAVVLDQAFERLPGEIEPVEARISPLERGDHAQGLGVVVEAAIFASRASSARSPAWPKGGWPRSCASASASVEILVDTERARDRAGDLRHFESMGEARAVVIALVIDEDLGLVVQPAEGGRMQDAVAVAG